MAVKVVHEKPRVEDLGTAVSIMSSRRGLRRRMFHYTVMIIHYPGILLAVCRENADSTLLSGDQQW